MNEDTSDDGLSPSDRAALEELLATHASAESGYAALGRELGASATGEDPEERGRAAFQRRLIEIQASVCASDRVRQYCSDPNYADATSVAALVAGALVASHFSGLNVLLVACVCARLGLRNICQAAWDSGE